MLSEPIRHALLGFSLLLVTLAGIAWRAKTPVTPLPRDAVSDRAGWADENSCIDCHQQAESFPLTGHAQTLRPATDPKSLQLLERMASDAKLSQENTSLRTDANAVFASTKNGQASADVQLDWCFGSGNHACTWTSTMLDSSGATDQLEFRWTWYHGDVVDVTPGQPSQPTAGHFGQLGVLFDGPKSFRCFACHTSYLPEDRGAIDEAHLVAGVTCQRCHGPRQQHVDTEGEYSDPHWQPSDRIDAVNRCAQCHRRADELSVDEISTDNVSIVRFQPVGLTQSECFQKSQMTCTTCHDPHTPASQQDMQGIWQCVQCHSPEHTEHVLCGAGEVDECLRCHMPSVKMDSPVHFTDHWIRVRDADESP